MKILVVYQSKTGYTKKYAEWVSQDLKCDLENIKKLNKNIENYDLIIYGGWIMGGKQLSFNLSLPKKLNSKKLIVFGVGFTPKEEVDIKKMKNENKLEDTPLFYFQGGMNPKKMGFISKMIVRMVTKEKIVYKDN